MPTSRLLILDDDPQVGKMIQRIAESAGVQACCLTRTDEFFRTIDAWRPTHLAIDLVMPDMDGVQVLVELAKRRCAAKIIITSGVGTRVLDAAGRSANEHGLAIAGVLPKPFSPSALRNLLAGDAGADEDDRKGYEAAHRQNADVARELTPADLVRAIEVREFTVAFQPQVQCTTGELAGFEALVRWKHPQFGLLGPDRFITIAETAGVIGPLTDLVLDLAIDWFAPRFRGTELTVAVNLSSRSTAGQSAAEDAPWGLVDRITGRCRARALRPENLILELTETSAMEDPVASLGLLTRLRMKGFQLSIDDFGTGYSSMLQLVRLPFSEIKIDKSFVSTATRSIESSVIVESIINLGHSLDLRVVAEGVEDASTFEYLRAAGCDLAQGYLIAAPMLADDAVAWIEREAHRLPSQEVQNSLL